MMAAGRPNNRPPDGNDSGVEKNIMSPFKQLLLSIFIFTYQYGTCCRHRAVSPEPRETQQMQWVWATRGRPGQQSAKTGTTPHRALLEDQTMPLMHQHSLHREQRWHLSEGRVVGERERERDIFTTNYNKCTQWLTILPPTPLMR